MKASSSQNEFLINNPMSLPEIKLDHLRLLTDDTGILQHARYNVPHREHGYCTDDNSRALIAAVLSRSVLPDSHDPGIEAVTYLSFMNHAFNEKTGRFRNFMTYDRKWLEDQGSEDSHARAVQGLGTALLSQPSTLIDPAVDLFERALPAMSGFRWPRAWAIGLIGIQAFLECFPGHIGAHRILQSLAERLLRLYEENARQDWPWIDNCLTYSNGKIPQALLLAGHILSREDMMSAGLRALDWLMKIQTAPSGHFAPVGNKGWFPYAGRKADFDQQPVEAMAMTGACLDAYQFTGDEKWIKRARFCFEWFLGRNALNTPLYDRQTGACFDGLQPNGPNRNQGAESTLSWIISLLRMRIFAKKNDCL
ncbi:MAG: hypothetical protein ACE14T_03085 [Syntrophales bacterium]